MLILPVRGEAEEAISSDSKAFRVDETTGELEATYDASSVLGAYIVTSKSGNRAVISGPGGSRVVRKGKPVVLSGIEWMVGITSAGVSLSNDGEEIVLVFDESLSSSTRTSTLGDEEDAADTTN